MKAIVKVKKASSYSKFNGLTFPVAEIMDRLIALEIEGSIVDFSYTEVILVDFQEYYQAEFEIFCKPDPELDMHFNIPFHKMYHNLSRYARMNNIVFQLH